MHMDINTVPTCMYLYGVEPKFMATLADMTHKQALLLKVALGTQLLTQLFSLNFMEQDTQRSNKVANAIKFNNELLAELDYHE